MAKNLMVCGNANKALKLNESESTKERYILEGLFAGPFGVENRNKRIYQVDEYLKHLQYLRDDIKNGEPILGELDHPDDRFEVKLKDVSHRVIDLWYDKDSNTIQGKIELLNTPNGKLAQSLVDQGVPLHISSRAAGSVNSDKSVSIQQIYTFDLVCKPGFAGAVLHRVNESEDSKKYTDDVYQFLSESERQESMNTAPQFGMMNEDVSITEVAAEVKLRKEAENIKENNNTDDMINDKDNVVSEEQEVKETETVVENEEIKETEEVTEKKDENPDDNAKNGDDNKDEESSDSESDSDEEKSDDEEDSGIEIISVRAETGKDDDVEIEDVKSEDDEDSDKDEEKSDDEDKSDSDEEKSEEDETSECDTSECGDKDSEKDKTDEKTAKDIDDKEKEMLLDCDELNQKREKFEEKIDELIDAIKTKSEEEQTNESLTINKYPISGMLNESNFKKFMDLDEAQKNNVVAYLQDNRMVNPESVNENWNRGISYNPETEVWLKYAPDNYKKLYESASEDVRNRIKTMASYLLFENQFDVNRFWQDTGLSTSEERNILNENFINTMPKIVQQPVTNELPYGKDFIDAVTKMACEYNN